MKYQRIFNCAWSACSAVLLAVIFTAAASPCFAAETYRYELAASGPTIASQAPGEALTVQFKLGRFNAHNGGHLVIGRGDLLRYYNEGKYPLGSGVIVGESTGCNAPGQISIMMENWFEGGNFVDHSTCFNGLNRETIYTVVVSKNRYVLSAEGAVIADVQRNQGHYEVQGFFIIGATSTEPYTLLSIGVKEAAIVERLK